jgi:flagellar motor switch protein FliM
MGLPAENLPAGDAAVPADPSIASLFDEGASGAEGAPADAPENTTAANVSVLPSPGTETNAAPGLPFRQPSMLSPGQIRRLTVRHTDFVRSLSTRFSNFFRLDFGVELLGLQTVYYGQFLEDLPKPAHIVMFKLPPLNGSGLLALTPKFGLSLVDRLCGGAGKVGKLDRDLTEIETGLLDQSLKLVLREWGQAVAGQADANPEFLTHETNPRFLPARPSDAGTFVFTLKASFAEEADRILFGLPLEMVEPLARQWPPMTEAKNEPVVSTPKPVIWNRQFNSMRVAISAEWQGMEITARKLANLKVGDVLPLDAALINRTHVRIAKLPKFTGRLGKFGPNWAVELTEPLKA